MLQIKAYLTKDILSKVHLVAQIAARLCPIGMLVTKATNDARRDFFLSSYSLTWISLSTHSFEDSSNCSRTSASRLKNSSPPQVTIAGQLRNINRWTASDKPCRPWAAAKCHMPSKKKRSKVYRWWQFLPHLLQCFSVSPVCVHWKQWSYKFDFAYWKITFDLFLCLLLFLKGTCFNQNWMLAG